MLLFWSDKKQRAFFFQIIVSSRVKTQQKS